MIAVDTSSLIAYFSGEEAGDVEAVQVAFKQNLVVFPPVVLSELLSDPKLPTRMKQNFLVIPLLEVSPGYWKRVGESRAKLFSEKLKAKLADTLIAQSCIDWDVPLISRDRDFRHFKKLGLQLL